MTLNIATGPMPIAEGNPKSIELIVLKDGEREIQIHFDEKNLELFIVKLQADLAELNRRNSSIRKEETYK